MDKVNGMWNLLDKVDALIVPGDLQAEFDKRPGSEEFYNNLTKSIKKGILYWIISAKRPATKSKRILEIAENTQLKQLPKHFR